MKSQDRAIDRLEEARSWVNEAPALALRRLPRRADLPAALRAERDFLEAEARRATGCFKDAEALYSRVLSRLRPADDPPLWTEASLGSAAGLRCLGNVSAARARLKAAESACRRAGIRAYERPLRLERALVDRAAGRFDRSVRELWSLLRGALDRGASAEAAFILWAIGGAERFQGNLEEAEGAFVCSFALARSAKDKGGMGYAWLGLGGVTRVQGRFERSRACYAEAGRIFKGSDDLFAQAYAACGLGNAHRRLGRPEEAIRLYKQARKLYSRMGDEADLSYVDWGVGEALLSLGETAKAVGPLRGALEGFRKCGEARGRVLASISLAQALHALGETTEGERLFAAAYRLARKSGLHTHLERFT